MLNVRSSLISFQGKYPQSIQNKVNLQSNLPVAFGEMIQDIPLENITERPSKPESRIKKIKTAIENKYNAYQEKRKLRKFLSDFRLAVSQKIWVPASCGDSEYGSYKYNDKYNLQKCKDIIHTIEKNSDNKFKSGFLLSKDKRYGDSVFYDAMRNAYKTNSTDAVEVVSKLVDIAAETKDDPRLPECFFFQKNIFNETPYKYALTHKPQNQPESITLKLVDLLEKLDPAIRNEKILPAYDAAIEEKAYKTAAKIYKLAEKINLPSFPNDFKNTEKLSNIDN